MHTEKEVSKNNDEIMMKDLFNSQKYISQAYNHAVNEMQNQILHDAVKDILNDEYKIGFELLTEMKSFGWISGESTSKEQLKQVKKRFESKKQF